MSNGQAGADSNMIHRTRHIFLWFGIYTLLLAIALYGLALAYAEYQAHRARTLLAESARVQIGDSEGSVLQLVRRYGGFSWTPDPLGPKENWIDKDEYEYQKSLLNDYKYEIALSPFGTISRPPGRKYRVIGAIQREIDAMPSDLQGMLGMHLWVTTVELSIRNGQVQSISAMTQLEGRNGWLGHQWSLAKGMPHHDMQPRTYLIGAAFLTTGDGGGTAIENFFTPRASAEEVQAARNFNSECLTRLRVCAGLCELAPNTLRYLAQHPDVAWNIIPPKCH